MSFAAWSLRARDDTASYNHIMRTGQEQGWSGSSRRKEVLWRRHISAYALFVVLVGSGGLHPTAAKSQSPLMPQLPASSGQNAGRPQQPGQDPEANQDPMMRRVLIEAAKKRNIERQIKLTADSDKIVKLAEELSISLQPEGKSTVPQEMAKKADEIGKLARNVRDLMRSE